MLCLKNEGQAESKMSPVYPDIGGKTRVGGGGGGLNRFLEA